MAGYQHTLCARLYQIMTSVRALNILILNHRVELQRVEKQSHSGHFLSTYKHFNEHCFAYICALTQRVAETGTSDLQFNQQDAPAASNYI